MSMTTMVTGKIYNGSTHGWKDSKKDQRTMYRGRLNYRDRTNGEWYWIDAVCWKDFGDTDGLVGFLENHFSADSENAPKENGGQPIELVGYIRPTKKQMTVPLTVKKGGKPHTIDVPDVPYDSFEFVIESVDFPPSIDNGTRSKSKSANADLDFDDIDEEEISVGGIEDDTDDDDIELVDEEEPTKTKAQLAKEKKAKELALKKAKAKKEAEAKAKAKAKKEADPIDDEDGDDPFFED